MQSGLPTDTEAAREGARDDATCRHCGGVFNFNSRADHLGHEDDCHAFLDDHRENGAKKKKGKRAARMRLHKIDSIAHGPPCCMIPTCAGRSGVKYARASGEARRAVRACSVPLLPNACELGEPSDAARAAAAAPGNYMLDVLARALKSGDRFTSPLDSDSAFPNPLGEALVRGLANAIGKHAAATDVCAWWCKKCGAPCVDQNHERDYRDEEGTSIYRLGIQNGRAQVVRELAEHSKQQNDRAVPEMFFILSMERTRDGQACVWWRPNANGYTTSIGEAGGFTREEAILHSDPPHHLVIPAAAIEVPAARAKSLAKKALKESRFDVPKGGAK